MMTSQPIAWMAICPGVFVCVYYLSVCVLTCVCTCVQLAYFVCSALLSHSESDKLR